MIPPHWQSARRSGRVRSPMAAHIRNAALPTLACCIALGRRRFQRRGAAACTRIERFGSARRGQPNGRASCQRTSTGRRRTRHSDRKDRPVGTAIMTVPNWSITTAGRLGVGLGEADRAGAQACPPDLHPFGADHPLPPLFAVFPHLRTGSKGIQNGRHPPGGGVFREGCGDRRAFD